jgi:hypothetical protein
MSSFCNSIFFCKNKNDTLNAVISKSQQNMFTDINKESENIYIETENANNVVETNDNIVIEQQEQQEQQQQQQQQQQEQNISNEFSQTSSITSSNKSTISNENSEIVTPKQKDTLFWCVYIAINGYNDYLEIERNYGVKELEIKKQIADFITANSSKLKNTNVKITKVSIQEILSELLTSQKETSILCLVAMTVFYNINILLVDPTKKHYLEYISNKDIENPTFILYKDTYGNYSLKQQSFGASELEEFKSDKVCLENHLKPLKSISTYKTDDLESLSKKIGLHDESKKYKKNELYNLISEMIAWK